MLRMENDGDYQPLHSLNFYKQYTKNFQSNSSFYFAAENVFQEVFLLTFPKGAETSALRRGFGKALSKVSANNTAAKTSTTALTKFYPANNGFLGTAERTFLMPGEQISRYGSGAGKFFSPAGTPLPMRALPPGANTSIFNTYKVLKPFEVQAGKIAPAFGQPGLGTQYLTPVSGDVLFNRGIIGH